MKTLDTMKKIAIIVPIATACLAPTLPQLTTAHATTTTSSVAISNPDVTMAQLKTMFGSYVTDTARTRAALPALNAAMRSAGIMTPARKAAFLATIVNESRVNYAATQRRGGYYRGRGYIQLTGNGNYRAVGKALKVNLLRNPSFAATPKYAAPVATWYWTVARPTSNAAADKFDMGRISRNIGYAASSREDLQRCNNFKTAYKVLTGKNAPTTTICYRH